MNVIGTAHFTGPVFTVEASGRNIAMAKEQMVNRRVDLNTGPRSYILKNMYRAKPARNTFHVFLFQMSSW